MKFEIVQIHFLSDVFSLLPSRKFVTMAKWHNDFSSLLEGLWFSGYQLLAEIRLMDEEIQYLLVLLELYNFKMTVIK